MGRGKREQNCEWNQRLVYDSERFRGSSPAPKQLFDFSQRPHALNRVFYGVYLDPVGVKVHRDEARSRFDFKTREVVPFHLQPLVCVVEGAIVGSYFQIRR